MTPEQLKNTLYCEIDYTTVVSDLFPVKTEEIKDFAEDLRIAVSDLKKKLSGKDFKKFEKLIAQKINEHFPEVEMYSILPTEDDEVYDLPERKAFLMLLDDNEYAPLDIVQDLFVTLIGLYINTNLKDAVVEFFSFTNTLPSTGQVFQINKNGIKELFKEFGFDHIDLFTEFRFHYSDKPHHFYLKESIYAQRSNLDNPSIINQFQLRFCLWDTGDIY